MSKHSFETGISFGITSGIITTLGLIVGLHSGTGSKAIIIGGIFTIAVADAFSDALGIHVSEEAEKIHTEREIWLATLSTFASKFFVAMTFMVPVFILDLSTALIVSQIWGLSLLSLFSFYIAKDQQVGATRVIGEHLLIAIVVITVTHFIGDWVASAFNHF